jgi:pyroglutamyl-peptidase
MKKLVIFAFEPFGGESINPSLEILRLLPDAIGEYRIIKHSLPVVFGEAADLAIDLVRSEGADAVICLGQAGGREWITPELVAINLRNADIPDNLGNLPKDTPILEGGREAYFSTLPVRKMAEAISGEGIASRLSYSAGAYVCNDLYYSLLHSFHQSGVGVCFIHVPYSKEQGREPSMELCDMVRAITAAIGVI